MRTVSVISIGMATAIIGCSGGKIETQTQARALADAEINRVCETIYRGECDNLIFVKLVGFDSKWLVEYKSSRFMYSVTIMHDGSAEVGRFRND